MPRPKGSRNELTKKVKELDIVLEADVMNQHILDNNFQQAVY